MELVRAVKELGTRLFRFLKLVVAGNTPGRANMDVDRGMVLNETFLDVDDVWYLILDDRTWGLGLVFLLS